MTDQEKRIAIARHLGRVTSFVEKQFYRFKRRDCGGQTVLDLAAIPDYLNDLNAAHEMEKALPQEKRDEYFNELFTLLPCDENHGPFADDGGDIMTPSSFTQIHATARQRADAFLKTIGALK